jgi:hypothetical protein
MSIPKIVVRRARRRFGGRKQWKATPFAANGTKLDFNDTYANVGDFRAMLDLLRGPVELEIHYDSGVQRELLQ